MTAYLDHAATTAVRPEARRAMLPFLSEEGFGNPSGAHAVARAARKAVEDARDVVADVFGARPSEVIFTSGGTEADNLAVLGMAGAAGRTGAAGRAGAGGPAVVAGATGRAGAGAAAGGPAVAAGAAGAAGRAGTGAAGGGVLCSAVEHEAVLEPVRAVGGRLVEVDAQGLIDRDALVEALAVGPALVSVMLANNETGIIQPLDRLAELVRRKVPGALVHTDAVQAVGWLDPAAATAPADLVSVSAHKVGGPQGVGALIVRGRANLAVRALGGGQEAGRRSGTHNVAGIIGMAAALALLQDERDALVKRLGALRDRLADGLLAAVPGSVETGRREDKVAGLCHLCVPGVESEALVFLLDRAGVCASAGSACSSGAVQVSHVLDAMGVPAELAAGALRLSLGWTSTEADVDVALEAVPAAVAQLRRAAA